MSTFEDLAFLSVQVPADAGPDARGFASAVRVSFGGPVAGSLDVAITGEVLPILAANMLGTPVLPDERMQRDALAEVANIICGNTVPALVGPAAEVPLRAPVAIDADMAPPGTVVATTQLSCDEGSARVRLAILDPSPVGGGA